MSNFEKVAAETGDRYLAAVASSQERLLECVSAFARVAPKSPFPLAMSDSSGVRELSAAGFAFMEKLLEQQKAFSDRLLAGSAPVEAAPAPSAPAEAEPSATGPAEEASQSA